MIAALLLAAGVAAAAPMSHARPYWLKTYSLAPYRETWRGEISVKTLSVAMPKIAAAVEKSGGRLTQPLSNFVGSATEQQLSLTVPQKKSKALLAALRKIGKCQDPAVRPNGTPIPLEEVREKLARLTKEKTENRVALAQTPAAAEAVDEMIEHLANVEAVARSTDGEVLWNVTVKEAR
ncbi:MAG: hypothetical protein PHS14_02075 [Elusimicrobia bacterium]|nr:hypothetical protein [Elusimicrobiota bacterium]